MFGDLLAEALKLYPDLLRWNIQFTFAVQSRSILLRQLAPAFLEIQVCHFF